MGKSIIADLLRDNNFRYFFLMKDRIRHVGFMETIKQLASYYKKYANYPRLINSQSPDAKYKLFVFYNFFKIVAVNPDINMHDLMNYFPTRLQQYFIYELDPREKREITFDKILFYKELIKLGLPFPTVFFYVRNGRKLKVDGTEYHLDKDILPEKFFVKPINENGGERAGIYEKDTAHLVGDGFLAQELVTNHPDIVALSGKFAFNTVRIITYIDNNGKVNILSAIIRLSKGKQVDNWGKGSINVMVDIEEGTLGNVGITKRNERYVRHPEGKFNFYGFRIPYYKKFLDVVKKGSLGLKYLRFIAWDIGISKDGPIIVEANAGCDFFHAQLFNPYGSNILIREVCS